MQCRRRGAISVAVLLLACACSLVLADSAAVALSSSSLSSDPTVSTRLDVAPSSLPSPVAAPPPARLDIHFSLTWRSDAHGSRATAARLRDDDDHDRVQLWPNVFAKTLSSLYLALCLLSFVQLVRTIVHRHKIKSFRFGFLLICFVWTSLRVLFWFWVRLHEWPTWLADVIYFLPNSAQIMMFSLLILFYAKLVHRHRWRALRLRFLAFCVLSNTAMVLLTLTFSILMDRVTRVQHSDPTSEEAEQVREFTYKMYFSSSALFFGVLVVLAAVYLQRLRSARGPTAGTSKSEVAVTSLVFLIFLSRCIWDLLAVFDRDSTLFRHQIWETTTTHVKLVNAITFSLLLLWEVVPTLIVIGYFRRIPHTSDSYCIGFWSCLAGDGRCVSAVRHCLMAWPCQWPAEYFEKSVDSSVQPEVRRVESGADSAGVGGASSGGPEYVSMDGGDDGDAGSSVTLPPGSFVPVSAHAHAMGIRGAGAYGRSYSSSMGGGQIGSINLKAPGSTTDLYGSPTWLNPNHPLTQLSAASLPKPGWGAHSLHLQQAGGIAPVHAAYHAAVGAQHQRLEEEDDFAAFTVHPYTQQQQQQQQAYASRNTRVDE